MKYRTIEGDRLDLIAHKHYKSLKGTVEFLLKHNPGLADHGPVLPSGVLIELPEVAIQSTPVRVTLWS